MIKLGTFPLVTLLGAGLAASLLAPPLLIAQGAGTRGRAAGPPGADAITEDQLRAHLSFIASDLLEGRATGSRGLDVAGAFLASHLGRLGLRPAGDNGTFFQEIALTRRRLDVAKTTLTIGKRTLTFGDDFVPGDAPGAAEGRVVYVGNGTVIRSRGLDPYKDLDVRGRIVVSHSGLPTGVSQDDLKGPRGRDWERTQDAARDRGAAAVLFLPDFGALVRWSANRDVRRSRASLTVDAFDNNTAPALPSATLSPLAISLLFSGQAMGPQEIFERAVRREPAPPFALSESAAVALTVAADDERSTTRNIVAVLEGRDPRLKDEYVALGAHYDHLGVAGTPNAQGDTIFNGADDDGSGTVGILAVAEAMARHPVRPRRSLIFVWHTGEEQGLWGARYFTEHPTVPIDRIVAQLNVDMIGRGREPGEARGGPLALTDRDSIYVVGSRRLSPAFGALVERTNRRYLGLRYDYSLDDPSDPAQIYQRSDHYQYARQGIPIAFFFTGIHEDYHGLDDEIDRIDFTKMRRIVQTIYATARAVADDPAMSRRSADRTQP